MDDGDMMSEYILGDDDYGGGPSGATGCLVFIAVGLGTLIAGTWVACVWMV